MSRRKGRFGLIVKLLVVTLVGTVSVAVATAGPASALTTYKQGFEQSLDFRWSWNSTTGGSGGTYNVCGQARTGCGGVIMRHPAHGFISLFMRERLGAFSNGWCFIGYYAKPWKSTGAPTARLEVMNTDFTYIALTDKKLTSSSWTRVETWFYWSVPKDVIIRITLPGSGNPLFNDVGINVDDFSVRCEGLI